MKDAKNQLGIATLRRLPVYLAELKEMETRQEMYVSSAALARQLGFDPIQVRKDLAATGVVGSPRIGFEVKQLITAIILRLGWNNSSDAFIAGVGSMGSALLGYQGFEEYGLSIVAAFDRNPAVVGTRIHGQTVLDIEELAPLAKRMHVKIGVLTVVPEAAQTVCDIMLSGGIVAIWNFTPTRLRVPNHIVVQRVDLAADLAILSHKMSLMS